MDEYRIRLRSFEGPLDLLMHLVRKNEYDIFDIPMSEITAQYLAFLDVMRELDIEIAGEYLVMAATLAKIKSVMLLPRPEAEDGEEGPDPREELARQLLEYAKYREAAVEIGDRPMLGRDVFARKFPSQELEDARQNSTFLEVELFHLIEAFRDVLRRVPLDQRVHLVRPDRFSIRERVVQITEILAKRGSMMFDQLFDENSTRSEMITTFLAILELMKMRLIRIFQQDRLSPIHLMTQVSEEKNPDGEPTESTEVGNGTADDTKPEVTPGEGDDHGA